MITDEKFTQIAQKYTDTVYRLAVTRLKDADAAKDVTQNTFLKLYGSSKEFESDSHIKNWLIRVALNECRMVFRSPRYREESIDAYAESLPAREDVHHELLSAVMGLERKYRIPLYLFYYEDYSVREIASILSIPENTVKTRLARARKKLKAFLEDSE